ncbi:MAG: hypothetical protein ACYS67_19765, partial [Planctomycetota bacterium]
ITLNKPGDVPFDITNVAWEITEGAFSFPTFSKTLNKNLEALLSKKKRNYWLSGHTHAPATPRPSKIVVGGLLILDEKYFHGINTGSTTDYRAHVVIVESYERQKNKKVDKFVGYREIPLFDYREGLLTAILKAIGEYGLEHKSDQDFQNIIKSMDEWMKEEKSVDLIDSSFKTISQEPGNLLERGFSALGFKQKGALGPEERYRIYIGSTILGLNKKYRDKGWHEKQTESSARHLRTFMKLFVERTGNNRDDVISCIGFLAGAYECGKFPKGCDFNPSYMKKLCDKPK